MQGARLLLFAAFIIAVLPFAAAQVDSDRDGIQDSYDACPATNSEDGLPTIKSNIEFLGCSCRQIPLMMEYDSGCVELFCVPGRPFSMQLRQVSRYLTNCAPDFCIGDDLYESPKAGYAKCSEGMELEYNCLANITKDVPGLCALYPQGPLFANNTRPSQEQVYDERNESQVDTVPVTGSGDDSLVFLDLDGTPGLSDAELALIDSVYDAARSPSGPDSLRLLAGTLDREAFERIMLESYTSFTVSRKRTYENRQISQAVATLTHYSITIRPLSNREVTKLVVFMKLHDSAGQQDVVYERDPDLISGTDFVMFDYGAIGPEGVSVGYQFNAYSDDEPIVVIYAESKYRPFFKEWWPLLLIPVFGFLFYLWSRKQLTRDNF